jgi:nitrogen regulatory protein PII 2
MDKVNAIKGALVDAGFPSFTVRKVVGRGQGNVDARVIHGAEEGCPEAIARLKDDGPMLVPSRMMTFVVQDESVPKLVDAIFKICRGGQRDEGKIFVKPLLDAVRIRTGESGVSALT